MNKDKVKTDWIKKVILFLASQTISLFGSALVQYAIIWYITLKTESGIMMTVSTICGFLPAFFLSPFAGVWADRYDRKKLIMLSDSLIALATLLLAVLFMVGYGRTWLLFVGLAVRSLGSAVQTPAVSAILPQIVPENKLTKVNAANASIQSVIGLLAPLASGALLALASIESIFFIDVATAAVAVLTLLLFLHVPVHAKAAQKQQINFFTDMRMGLQYINSHRFIRKFLLFYAFYMFLVTPAAFLTPLQVTRSFGHDVWRLTAIEIAYSIGMILGGILLAWWGGFKNKLHTMTLADFFTGLTIALLGVIPKFPLYLVVMGLAGLALPYFNTPATVLIQEKVEESYLGRVFGVISMIASSVMPFGMLIFGPLSDVMRIEWLLVITGLLIFIQGFFLYGSKTLREAGESAG